MELTTAKLSGAHAFGGFAGGKQTDADALPAATVRQESGLLGGLGRGPVGGGGGFEAVATLEAVTSTGWPSILVGGRAPVALVAGGSGNGDGPTPGADRSLAPYGIASDAGGGTPKAETSLAP